MVNPSITFEQPVNELIRVCLRLEHLLAMAQQGLRGQHVYDTRNTITSLIDTISLTDRPDLRGKFTKEFLRHKANLQRFMHDENIDQNKLKLTLSEIENAIQTLQSSNGKFAANLRENEFITAIKQHLAMAGGALSFDTPAYHFWLQYPVKERHAQILEWLGECEDFFQIIGFLLRLVRQSGRAALQTAHVGFYQASLDATIPCQLIRVGVADTLPVYPEISVGRHGVSIRFYHRPSIQDRAVPYEKDVPFRLSCCII